MGKSISKHLEYLDILGYSFHNKSLYGIWYERRDGKKTSGWLVPPNMPMFSGNRKVMVGIAVQNHLYDECNQKKLTFYICELGDDGYPIKETMELITHNYVNNEE